MIVLDTHIWVWWADGGLRVAQELVKVWYASPQNFRRSLRWTSRSEKGVLEVSRPKIKFSGEKTKLSARSVRSVSVINRPIPWLGILIDNLLILLVVTAGVTSVYTWNNPATPAVIVGINLFLLFLCARVKWVQVEFADEKEQPQFAYFTDGSSFGMARALGGADELYHRIKAALHITAAADMSPGTTSSNEKSDSRIPTQEVVSVTCEECSGVTVFAGSKIGSVQQCSQCGAYLDVEKPDAYKDGNEEGQGDEQNL